MMSTYEKLSKVLDLEREQGYENRAVIGGLIKFLQVWRDNAAHESTSSQDTKRVDGIYATLADYARQSSEERVEAVAAALAIMSGEREPPEGPEVSSTIPSSQDAAPNDSPAPEEAPAERPRRPQASRQAPAQTPDYAPVDSIRGISNAYSARLENLGVTTVGDLLYLFPRRYDDFSSLKRINQLVYGEEVTIVATIWETHTKKTHSGRTLTQSILTDGTGMIQATWFGQAFLERQLQPGRDIVVSGKVDEFLGRLTFSSPAWEPLQRDLVHTGRLVPIYPLTEGIKQRWLRRTIKNAMTEWTDRLEDSLPTGLRLSRNLMDVKTSILQMHFPDDWEALGRARSRLCFEEFLYIQLGVLRQRQAWQQSPGQPLEVDRDLLRSMLESLAFSLTNAQQRVLEEILQDMQKAFPMSRLLQGDVGSGKTVVTVLAMLIAVANGAQAAIMVPTEILAEQHYRSITQLVEEMARIAEEREDARLRELVNRTQIRLLTGSVPQQEKDDIYAGLASGAINLIVGTHAVIQEGVVFADLALAVIDEQHRFGVDQRASLRQKAHNPHMLVMSATPIPRTLALSIYGDLDVSVIDEMPPHRQQVVTRWLYPRERERAYAFVKTQIEKGHQAFVICPLIEESDMIEAKAATTEYERLQRDIFPNLSLGLLHGRMRGAEKEQVMAAFDRGEFHILVSTSVVEVGIDVPNATVMMVEGANRFGLAQLHQFRGRVGRGAAKSYCLLLSDTPTEKGEQRLQIIESTHDGFALAEEDLKMRGPGEFFGTRQSGLPDLRVARLSDIGVLEEAREAAMEIFQQDPELEAPENRLLAAQVERFWSPKSDQS